MRKLIIGGAFIISLINNKSFSQEQESALDPITVTSSLTKEKASQTGRNIFVISGERFSSLPVHSIDELLRYLPGIEMQARGPFGAQSDLVVRGGTFQQVLVIVDGIRLNDPNTGHFSSYIPIAPSEIERIELLKGASSSVYGSEAVGGVIHIITKSFNAQKDISKSTAGIQLTAGEYDLFSVNAGGFTTNGKSSFGAGILSNNTKGQAQRGTRGFVYAHTASASFGHHFNDKWKVAIRSSFDDRDFSAQNFYTTFLSDTSKERVKTLWNQFQLSFDEGGSHNINVQAGYKKLWDKFSFNSVALPNENISDLLQGLITDEWRVRTTSVITTGLQFINKKIASNDRGNHAVKQTAAFAILNQQIGSNFHINPSLRWEWNERAGTELIPQVNIS
ncbi:MAG TPA: TonB-dependent receptor, partial [Flavisolibacter sp.]|nr:TonB-dependent receptor [Flavisolibacter sp.]